MLYKKLGTLPANIISDLKSMILSQDGIVLNKGFTRIEFNKQIADYMANIFENTDLVVQQTPENGNRLIQKAFFSGPNFTYPIHRDGVRCQSALNIILDCGDNDWTRWYDHDLIMSVSDTKTMQFPEGKSTRNTTIPSSKIHELDYIDEYKSSVGDVCVLNVDQYHTWYSGGPQNRLVIQTKFKGFPNLETIYTSLSKQSYKNIIKG